MTQPFNPKRPRLLLRSYVSKAGSRGRGKRAQRVSNMDLSDQAAAERTESIARRTRHDALEAAGHVMPDMRERYLSWLRSGHDARYYPMRPWGPAE